MERLKADNPKARRQVFIFPNQAFISDLLNYSSNGKAALVDTAC